MVPIVETFPVLDALPTVRAAFIGRVPGVDVCTDRTTALERLAPVHRQLVSSLGFADPVTAEQVHGNMVAVVDGFADARPIAGTDGLLTVRRDVCLGIYVADCAAVFLADRNGRAIALVHSGKKGTESGIVGRAVMALRRQCSIEPSDLCAVISPCIRPPHYEVDFAAEIVRQLSAAGVGEIFDCARCTASEPEKYYSYRREKGTTGRMLALLQLVEI